MQGMETATSTTYRYPDEGPSRQHGEPCQGRNNFQNNFKCPNGNLENFKKNSVSGFVSMDKDNGVSRTCIFYK